MNNEESSFCRKYGLTLLVCTFLSINILLSIPLGTSPSGDLTFVDYYVVFSALASGPFVYLAGRGLIMVIGGISLLIIVLLAFRNLRGEKQIPFSCLLITLWFLVAYTGIFMEIASISG
jgi:hypothetical protein